MNILTKIINSIRHVFSHKRSVEDISHLRLFNKLFTDMYIEGQYRALTQSLNHYAYHEYWGTKVTEADMIHTINRIGVEKLSESNIDCREYIMRNL